VATYRVFNQTVDEPIHIAAGYRWLSTSRYEFDPEHPPLARIGFGLASFLRKTQVETLRDLALARAANLPWLLLTLIVVYAWSARRWGRSAGILSLALVSALPPVLAHAGVATTDMAAAATVTAALYAYATWLRNPRWRNALLFGLALAAGLLAKFSFPVFFVAGALALSIGGLRERDHRWSVAKRAAQMAVVVFIALLGIWAFYKFSVGTLHDVRRRIYPAASNEGTAARYDETAGYDWVRADLIDRYREFGRDAAHSGVRDIDFVDWARAVGYPSPQADRHGDTMANAPAPPAPSFTDRVKEPFRRLFQILAMRVPLPAPWFFGGIEAVHWHATGLHPAFLLGRYHDSGWWYYFPVVFFFKTPLPLIVLAFAGIALLAAFAWRDRDGESLGIALAPAVMFLPALLVSLNIGVRHILPVYPILCMCAAYGALRLWRLSRTLVVALVAWYFISTAIAHPDYLAWFNEAAGGHPERIAVDSNLDWGQDLLRLREAMRSRGIGHVDIAYFGSADPRQLGIVADDLPPKSVRHGWIAISEMRLVMGKDSPDDYSWLKRYAPVSRVGRSIRLYYVP